MEIFLICFSLLMIGIGNFIHEDNEGRVGMFCANIICLLLFALGIYSLAYDKGVKDGAYNQLRGKYEVIYVINKDSCVVDTVININ